MFLTAVLNQKGYPLRTIQQYSTMPWLAVIEHKLEQGFLTLLQDTETFSLI
jgi:hypothetical protein